MITVTTNTDTSTINELELTSIKAMLWYTAYTRKVSEDLVRDALSMHFNVNKVQDLPRKRFDEAIRYLADIQSQISSLKN